MACLVFRLCDNAPEILRDVCLDLGWKEYDEGDEENDWNLWWKTSGFRTSDFEACRPWQRLNHFPKSIAITRKDSLARNLRRMKGIYGNSVYNFIPLSFILPNDYRKFVSEYSKQKEGGKAMSWICKPADQSRGKGIFIFRDLSELTYDCATIVQKYIPNPLLIAGYKFDLRIYVLVTSFCPLNIYVYHEGLVRFGTEKFNLNCLDNVFSHLTNTSINKQGPCYAMDKERIGSGCKWSIGQLRTYFHQNHIDDRLLWYKMNAIIILTLLAQVPEVQESCANCFELFGFDILVDANLKPWLLEVNFSPSLGIDCALDLAIKKPLLQDTLEIVNLRDSDIASYDNCLMNTNDKKRIKKVRPNSQIEISQARTQSTTASRNTNRGFKSRLSLQYSSSLGHRKLIAYNSESDIPLGNAETSGFGIDKQIYNCNNSHDGKDDNNDDASEVDRYHKNSTLQKVTDDKCLLIYRQSKQVVNSDGEILGVNNTTNEVTPQSSPLVSRASLEFHAALCNKGNDSTPTDGETKACNHLKNTQLEHASSKTYFTHKKETFVHPESSINGEDESEEQVLPDCLDHRKASSVSHHLSQQRSRSSMNKTPVNLTNYPSSRRSLRKASFLTNMPQKISTRKLSLTNWKDKYESSFKVFSKMKLCNRVGDYILVFPFNDACQKCCSSKPINTRSAIDEVKKAIYRGNELIKATPKSNSQTDDEKPLDLNNPYWGFSYLFDYSAEI